MVSWDKHPIFSDIKIDQIFLTILISGFILYLSCLPTEPSTRPFSLSFFITLRMLLLEVLKRYAKSESLKLKKGCIAKTRNSLQVSLEPRSSSIYSRLDIVGGINCTLIHDFTDSNCGVSLITLMMSI